MAFTVKVRVPGLHGASLEVSEIPTFGLAHNIVRGD